jgi:5'-nucleotidase / UDP-sugar diphosphatase
MQRKFVGLLTVLLALALVPAVAAREVQLTILHENDVHGHARPFCYPDLKRDERCAVGGAARRATLIQQIRARSRDPVLLIDAGDTTTRGPLATEYAGIDMVELMNAMGVALAVLGNNEFKLRDVADAADAEGAQGDLARLVRRSNFPWLGANVTDARGALLQGVQPYVVRRFGELRIAFLGLTTPRSGTYRQTSGLTFQDPVEAASVWVPRAREEADVVIAVTHLGVDDDRRLARSVAGIDAIVGGDSHTFLAAPVEERGPDGRVVPIVQAGEFGVVLGRFLLTFSDQSGSWRLLRFDGKLVPVDGTLPPDPAVKRLVERYAKPLDTAVGRVAAPGATRSARRQATAERLAEIWRRATGAELGLQYDSDIYDTFRDGVVTRYDVRAVLPFHEHVVVGALEGVVLQRIAAGKASLAGIQPTAIDPARTYRVAMGTLAAQRLKLAVQTDVAEDTRRVAEAQLALGAGTAP